MKYGWFGDYKTWNDAIKDSHGYNDNTIFNKTKNAMLKVVEKKNIYERDSVLFDRIEYEFHQTIIAGILKFALSKQKKQINILDFGGSLGTLYYALKSFVHPISLTWNIVEQAHYVDFGKEHIPEVNFYSTVDECLKEQNIDIIILSSVLHYLEHPYQTLEELLENNIDYIILDKTATFKDFDRLTVQKVPPNIYDSSYPAWFLNEQKLKKIFKNHQYTMIADFVELWQNNIPDSKFKGYIYAKNCTIKT